MLLLKDSFTVVLVMLLCQITLILTASSFQSRTSFEKQVLLSQILNETLKSNHDHKTIVSSRSIFSNNESLMKDICADVIDETTRQRTGCCTPSDVKHMHNVLVNNGKFVLFGESKTHKSLPAVTSVRTQQKIHFNVGVEYSRNESYSSSPRCLKYFDGTLHVVGRSTVKNVYHAIADNALPLVTQMLLDGYLAPEFLHLPRMLLVVGAGGREEAAVPHMQIVQHLMSAGSTDLKSAEGTCFRRVVWGHGPHVLYVDTMVELRRKASEFLRRFAIRFYDIKVPPEFQQLNTNRDGAAPAEEGLTLVSHPTHRQNDLTHHHNNTKVSRPLKIVVYSRGSSGKGRSMKGEELLVAELTKRGATALLCCDFSKLSLAQQLAYAVHADVIIGMHGAAIVHGVFMRRGTVSVELKTQYGYDAILFALVADSRQGIHGQVDVRKYLIPGGHRPIDPPLVNRTMAVLEAALNQQAVSGAVGTHANRRIVTLVKPELLDSILPVSQQFRGDFVVGPSASPDLSVHHILGPMQSNQTAVCNEMLFTRLRRQLEYKGQSSFHCDICTTYVVRI